MAKKKTFTVTVNRIAYAQREIEVVAKNKKEAEKIAISEAGKHSFSEHDADYEVEGVIEE